MIINVRGNHASGKSTVVRNVLGHFKSTPIYGLLGTRFPEAYRCERPGKRPLFVLGPYNKPTTAGGDYITKKGTDATLDLFDKYEAKGDLLYEGSQLSMRFSAPTIGAWLEKHKKDVIVVVLDVSLKECLATLYKRWETAQSKAHNSEIHMKAQHRQLELVLKQMKELGFRLEYVKREEAVERILLWLGRIHTKT